LPSTPHDHQAIEPVLAQTDLQTLCHHLITELSGSGQRRVILTRALAGATTADPAAGTPLIAPVFASQQK
jgi:ABC-type cobalamin/Fe3+-siderophores transport system ATPase subunit